MLADLDPDTILAKQVEQLEREKKELQAKLKAQEKKVDHFVRACHLVSSGSRFSMRLFGRGSAFVSSYKNPYHFVGRRKFRCSRKNTKSTARQIENGGPNRKKSGLPNSSRSARALWSTKSVSPECLR